MKNRFKLNAVQIAISMAVLTMGSKLIGFAREMVLANFFGTSYVVDVYVMSLNILSVLFGGIIASISTAYMPIFARICEKDGEDKGNVFTGQIINLLLLITLGISLIGIFFSDEIIAIGARGFSGESADLGSFYIKILFSYVIFSSVSMILEAYLQYKGTFLPQIVSGYLVSSCMIACIVVSYYTSYYYLAFGVLAGYGLRCISIFNIARKKGYKHSRSVLVGENAKEIGRLAMPVFFGSYITYINLFIDKTLASGLMEGSIAALNYAALLNGMIISITITILATIVYPKLTQANELKQYERFNEIVATGVNIVLIIGIPCSLGAMIYSKQVIQIVYERGAFDEVATGMTASAFCFYAMGLLFMALNEFIVRTYYSMHDMKTPMIFGAVGVIINIILNVILIKYMAHSGLALATSIAAVCNTLLLSYNMKKKHGHIKLVPVKTKVLKLLCSAVISVGVSYAVYSLIVQYLAGIIFMRVAQLGISVCVAIIVYLLCLKLFKIEEIKFITLIFKNYNK